MSLSHSRHYMQHDRVALLPRPSYMYVILGANWSSRAFSHGAPSCQTARTRKVFMYARLLIRAFFGRKQVMR